MPVERIGLFLLLRIYGAASIHVAQSVVVGTSFNLSAVLEENEET